jgi:Holliday junction resolvasome RuvABC endonuclease subunit
MKVLAFDPGAVRMGWAVLEKHENKGVIGTPILHASGISGVRRGDLEYQHYRLQLIEFWLERTENLLQYKPDLVVNEIIPAVGGGNFVVATQSQLAATAITTVQSVTLGKSIPVIQIGATTVKKRIGGNGKATKVQVRNGAMALTNTQSLKKYWTSIMDEPDAIAIGLAAMGYSYEG